MLDPPRAKDVKSGLRFLADESGTILPVSPRGRPGLMQYLALMWVTRPSIIALTTLRGGVNVKGRVLEPGRDRDVFLDEGRYLAPEHPGVARQDVGVSHLHLVLLAHHWKRSYVRPLEQRKMARRRERTSEGEKENDQDERVGGPPSLSARTTKTRGTIKTENKKKREMKRKEEKEREEGGE